jgi:inward rectifier potassium channel
MSKSSSTVRAGKLEFLRKNTAHRDWRDLYRSILSLSWPRFSLVVLAVYLVLNVLFATAYTFGGPCIAEMRTGSFTDAFFFGVQTLSTVGFGHFYPATLYHTFRTCGA